MTSAPAVLGLAAVGGGLLAWAPGLRGRDWRTRWLVALLPMGALLVARRFVEWLGAAPMDLFNASRVASSIAMARGYNLLQGRGEGPVLDFMYGPVSAAAYVPAAWSPTPTGAIWVGVALSVLFIVGSFAWLAFGSAGPRSRILAGAAVVCFALLGAHDPAISHVASKIIADAPAIALAACACACCLSRRIELADGRMVLAAIFAALAVWAKQTQAPIVVALPAWVWLRDGRRPALRFAMWMGLVGALVSALFLLRFGFEGIAFTMFQIPAGHRWPSGDPASQHPRLLALLHSLERLGATSVLSGVLLAAVLALHLPELRTPGRRWLRERPWLGLAWVGVLMIPVSALGGAKLGGARNSYAPTTYFLLSAGVLGLAQLAELGGVRRRLAATVALTGIVAFACVDATWGDPLRWAYAVGSLRTWRSNSVERATAFARAHPNQVLFAENPLIGLYADGLLYSSTLGFRDRILAGYPVPVALRERYRPSALRYVASFQFDVFLLTPAQRARIGPMPPVKFFPGFTKRYLDVSLPFYVVWTKSEGGAGAHRPKPGSSGSAPRTAPPD